MMTCLLFLPQMISVRSRLITQTPEAVISLQSRFENYFLLALLLQVQADVVFEKNGSRKLDFRKCYKKLNSKDGLFKLQRPVRPEMVRKEICINLFVFNLIKALMGRTAQYIGKKPREISFKAAQETLASFHQTLLMASVDSLEGKVNSMLKIISQHIVANRPGRSEPRAVKRRPKPHQRLQHSRSQARRLNKYKG